MTHLVRPGACVLALITVAATAACEDSTAPTSASANVRVMVTGNAAAPREFQVSLDGRTAYVIRTNTAIDITGLVPGTHTLRLDDLPAGCITDGNPRSLLLAAGQYVQATFSVYCAPPDSDPCYYYYYCWDYKQLPRVVAGTGVKARVSP